MIHATSFIQKNDLKTLFLSFPNDVGGYFSPPENAEEKGDAIRRDRNRCQHDENTKKFVNVDLQRRFFRNFLDQMLSFDRFEKPFSSVLKKQFVDSLGPIPSFPQGETVERGCEIPFKRVQLGEFSTPLEYIG